MPDFNIFLSWSGRESRLLAGALRDFLPLVIPSATVWMSEKDIPAGGLWKSDLHQRLEHADFGVVCVNPENTTAPWLIYEVGCLAMRVQKGRLIPLLQNLEPRDLPEPLNSFQTLSAHREGVLTLVRAINSASPNPQPGETLERDFEARWPLLERQWQGHVSVTAVSGIHVIRILTKKLLDENNIALIRRKLTQEIEAGHTRLVVDLAEVEHLSSAALGALILNHKKAENGGGRLVLANVKPEIQEVFAVTKLDEIFGIYESTEDAIAGF